MDPTFTAPLAHPFYGDDVLYQAVGLGPQRTIRAWEFNGWQAESMSWKTGCYIHAGLSGRGPLSMKGPGAKEYLQRLIINSLENFPVGTMKHAVMCNEDGLIAAHGIVERKAEDEFESFAGGPPGQLAPAEPPPGVEIRRLTQYLFQVAGPKSLHALEKVTGERLRDIGFLSFRNSSINGMQTEVARIGMTGSLAYELHGPIEEGPEIYQAVYEAGQEFGIERLGFNTYMVNHVEGGFPQGTWTFVTAPPVTARTEAKTPTANAPAVSGSVDPDNMRARWRTPVEVRWHNMARFDHDFVGSDALAAEIANPKRTTVILRWNPEDVLDIYASLLRPGEAYKPIALPHAPREWPQAHADHVLKEGREIGVSSGTIYSYYYREVLSMGCIDLEAREIGNEVIVRWGDYGRTIKDVRATVERFPYLTEGRNNKLDVAALA